jgi:hypothetical protein
MIHVWLATGMGAPGLKIETGGTPYSFDADTSLETLIAPDLILE